MLSVDQCTCEFHRRHTERRSSPRVSVQFKLIECSNHILFYSYILQCLYMIKKEEMRKIWVIIHGSVIK